ncbi:MAG: hypothetical protein REI11_11675 [Patulibacter sp.]|nr:hypothetical protein [Patulibacter sp.]
MTQPYEDDLPPLATRERLGRLLGYGDAGFPTTEEQDRADELLAAVSEEIRDVAGITWTDDDGELTGVPPKVQSICAAAAARAFGNPEGLTQRTIGDSTKGWDRTAREGGEVVFLTEREERQVRRAAGNTSMVSVTTVSAYDYTWIVDPLNEVAL